MTLSRDILERRLRTPFRYYESVGSTNDAARDWLLSDAPTGAAVIADEQTRGRGRLGGRSWQTPPGAGLAVSLILHPEDDYASRVVQLGALAVSDLVASLGPVAADIKPPNDVLVKGKKIAGILPEAVWDGANLRGVVLGIGLNVRLDFTGTSLEDSAASLETLLGRRLDRADLLEALVQRVMYWYARIKCESIMRAWKARSGERAVAGESA